MSLRALLIGIAGIAAICWIVSGAELIYLQSGFLQLPPAALVMLALLLGFRAIAGGRLRLSTNELTILYCMFLLAALVASRGLMEKLISPLAVPHYFASVSNHWAENYFPYIPRWAVAFAPRGTAHQLVSRAYYEGLRAGETIPWKQWLLPLAAWSILVGLVFGAFLSLAALLRRPWVEHERLAFPLARVPLALLGEGDGGPLWRRPLMWAGFAVPAFVYSINSLQAWYPSLPTIPTQYPSLTTWFADPPWSNVYWTPVFISYAALGLLYFVPLDLLFSLWFFFLAARIQEGIFTGFGMEQTDMPLYPCRLFIGYQVAGAYIVLALGLLQTAAPFWWAALRGRAREESATKEPIPPRAALAVLAACLVGMALWTHALGASFGWALAQWVIFIFVVCLVMTRSVSEGGMLMTETSFRPVDLYALTAPIHSLGRSNLTALAMLDSVWYRDQRGIVLSGLLDAMKLGTAERVKPRTFLLCLCLALGASTLISAHAQIWLAYHLGAMHFYPYLISGNPLWGYDFYSPHLTSAVPASWQAPFFFITGCAVTAVLIGLRTAFVGWPLLPLGYALCGSWTMILLWFPCLAIWALKGALLRYGGRRTYHRLSPFFLGLILGEFSMVVVWTLASAFAGIPAPQFPWP